MGCPTPSRFGIFGFIVLLALSPAALGHYRDNPDEATRPPQILREPDFNEIPLGEAGSLIVYAIGAGTLEYQWYQNGEAIEGGRSNVLEIAGTTRADAGLYQVTITSEFGMTHSKVVRLRVDIPENLQAISRTRTGDQHRKTVIEFYDGYFIAGGLDGSLSRSMDGYSWEKLDAIPGNLPIRNLVAGDDRLLAVLPDGLVAWTTDFANWQTILVDQGSRNVESVVYSQGVFAALIKTISFTQLLTSENGSEWDLRHEFGEGPGNNRLFATKSFFIAARSNENGTEFATSSDGINWASKLDTDFANLDTHYAFDSEAIIRLDGKGYFVTSDGNQWNSISVTALPLFDKVLQVEDVYYGLQFNVIYESTDLLSWETVYDFFSPFGSDSQFESSYATFEYGNGRFAIGPFYGSIYPVIDFNDPPIAQKPEWAEGSSSNEGIVYLNNQFIIWSSSGEILTSDNGRTWHRKRLNHYNGGSSFNVNQFAYGNGTYLTGDALGPDLDSMRSISPNYTPGFGALCFGAGVFVGLVPGNGIYYLGENETWVSPSGEPSGTDLIFAGGNFLAVGGNGTISFSENGKDWIVTKATNSGSEVALNFTSVISHRGRYVASIEESAATVFYESVDGMEWSNMGLDFQAIEPNPELHYQLSDMAAGDGRVMFVFENRVFETVDFENWKSTIVDVDSLSEVSYGGGTFVAIGQDSESTIVQLGQSTNLPPRVAFRNGNIVHAKPHKSVDFEIETFDIDGEVASVEIFIDGKLHKNFEREPYGFSWTPKETGIFQFSARVQDDDGLVGLDAITLSVAQNLSTDQIQPTSLLRVVEVTVFNDTVYVLGENGSIYRLVNSGEWQIAHIPEYDRPLNLKQHNGLMYAPSNFGVYVSNNGRDWVYHNPLRISGIQIIGDWFVTILDDQTDEYSMSKSRDLINWIPLSLNDDIHVIDVVGAFGDSIVVKSEDPNCYNLIDIWGDVECRTLPSPGSVVNASTYDGMHYLWIDPIEGASPARLYRSENGTDWTFINPPIDFYDVVRYEKVGNLFVVQGTPDPKNVYVSNDGFLSWHNVGHIGSILYHNDQYVAILDSRLATSSNGIDWTSSSEPVVQQTGNLAAYRESYLAWDAGRDTSFGLYESSDAKVWSRINREDTLSTFSDLDTNGSLTIAISQYHIATSTNGKTWEFIEKPESMGWSIAYGDGLFVVSGAQNEVFLSDDGELWQNQQIGSFEGQIASVEFLPDAGIFILENRTSDLWTSTDGIDWASHSVDDLVFTNFSFEGEFLFANAGSQIYRTQDGANWTLIPESGFVSRILFQNGVYLSLTFRSDFPILRSIDGINWELLEAPFERWYAYLEAIDSGFYVIVNSRTEEGYFSMDGVLWHKRTFNLPISPSISVDGERYSLGSSIFKTDYRDLSFDLREASVEPLVDSDFLEVKFSITNRSDTSIELEGIEIASRRSLNSIWTESPANILDSHILSSELLEPDEKTEINMMLELPPNSLSGDSLIQLLLNPKQSPPEIDISNNYAWLRLLPAPEISIEEQHHDSVSVSWTREGGYVKRVEFSHDLENWFLLDAPAESTESGNYTESIDPDKETYYRVRAE